MNGTTHFKKPIVCTECERQEFARLVREGFKPVIEPLQGRILDAEWLAFHYAVDDVLTAVAALKSPKKHYREDVFKKANVQVSSADYRLELGWVFVLPAYRGRRIALTLCQQLLTRVQGAGVFATTRADNVSMARILLDLGFTRVGKPYPRREEELVVFLRAQPISPAQGRDT